MGLRNKKNCAVEWLSLSLGAERSYFQCLLLEILWNVWMLFPPLALNGNCLVEWKLLYHHYECKISEKSLLAYICSQSYDQDSKLRRVLNDFCCFLSNQNPVLENVSLVIKEKKKKEKIILQFFLKASEGVRRDLWVFRTRWLFVFFWIPWYSSFFKNLGHGKYSPRQFVLYGFLT